MVIAPEAVNRDRWFLARRSTARLSRLPPLGKAASESPMSRNKFPPKPRHDPDDGPIYLYGLHTVRAALDNPARGKRTLLATPNALGRLRESGGTAGLAITEISPRELDRLLGKDAVHQGLAL
jgi:23S rRNA (guanosine2251-2'-O)-methyltransferase